MRLHGVLGPNQQSNAGQPETGPQASGIIRRDQRLDVGGLQRALCQLRLDRARERADTNQLCVVQGPAHDRRIPLVDWATGAAARRFPSPELAANDSLPVLSVITQLTRGIGDLVVGLCLLQNASASFIGLTPQRLNAAVEKATFTVTFLSMRSHAVAERHHPARVRLHLHQVQGDIRSSPPKNGIPSPMGRARLNSGLRQPARVEGTHPRRPHLRRTRCCGRPFQPLIYQVREIASIELDRIPGFRQLTVGEDERRLSP